MFLNYFNLLVLKLNFKNNKKYYFNIFQKYCNQTCELLEIKKKKLVKDAFGVPPQLKTKLFFFKKKTKHYNPCFCSKP
ncbi:hypothetical protein Peur_063077 [Populus x canadensis]|jgi:hypothetical protein